MKEFGWIWLTVITWSLGAILVILMCIGILSAAIRVLSTFVTVEQATEFVGTFVVFMLVTFIVSAVLMGLDNTEDV